MNPARCMVFAAVVLLNSDFSVGENLLERANSSATPIANKPPCSGTCHGSMMSLFCEQIDTSSSCPEGEYCCIRRSSRVVPTPEPEIPDCKGFCTPTFLSGLCYRPSRIILKTTRCGLDMICCDPTEDSENEMRRGFW